MKKPFSVPNNHLFQRWFITGLAMVLFTVMFVFKKSGAFDFWYWMSSNLVIVLTIAFVTDKENLTELKRDFSNALMRKILMGVLFALILFLVFYFGNIFIRFLAEKAGEGISNVYAFKQDASPWRIGLLMFFIIGPGEELFWRGYLQRWLSGKYGLNQGFVIATLLYTVVHVATGNLVLVLAAFICGAFWGWLYKKYHSMTINMVSHTVWDIAVFILMPFNQ